MACDVSRICAETKEASVKLSGTSASVKNAVLYRAKELIKSREAEILEANARDIKKAEAGGRNAAFIDRLALNPARIDLICEGLDAVAALPDPVGEIVESYTLKNGLDVKKVRAPLGVIGIIFEARPNVSVDAAALIGAEAGTRNVEGTDYYVITPDVIASLSFNYGDVLVVADGVNIIVEGAFDKLFSLDMLTKDVGSDGKLLVGGELSAVGFTEKRGGYTYFSAADISYFDGGVYTALQGNVSSPDYIVTATAMVDETSGGVTTTLTRKLTLVQLIETLA